MNAKSWVKRAGCVLFLVVAGTATGVGGYIYLLQWTGNFHSVIPGELYRSAQPTPERLESYVRDHGIKTVITVRGARPSEQWYQDMAASAALLNLQHVNFAISDQEVMPFHRYTALVKALRDAPKPILIHCKAGADRSGLASAIYLAAIDGQDVAVAERQLSLRFGHLAFPFPSAGLVMNRSWGQVKAWLDFDKI